MTSSSTLGQQKLSRIAIACRIRADGDDVADRFVDRGDAHRVRVFDLRC